MAPEVTPDRELGAAAGARAAARRSKERACMGVKIGAESSEVSGVR
jgi:hypothetical protein